MAFLRTIPTPALHKADTRRMCVEAVVSSGDQDRAGDVVEPRGIDWTVHKATGWVGYEHLRESGGDWILPRNRREENLPPVVIGTAIDPGTGRLSTVLKAIPGVGEVWVSKTWFDPKNRLQSQMFGCIETGALDGTSIEMTLKAGMYKAIGRSPIEPRDAYQVWGCNGTGFVFCEVPVQQMATVLKSLTPAAEARVRIAQTGKIGAEPAHPLILKSFARYLPGKSTTVTGGFTPPRLEKAMDADPPEMEAAYEEPDGDEAGGGDELSQVYDTAQQIEDLAGGLEAMADDTASVHLIKDLPKLAAVIRAAAEKVKAAADKHQGMIDAARGGKDEPAEADEPADMDKDDYGVLKAMKPHHYRFVKAQKAARVRRITKAEADAAPVVESAAPADPVAARAAQLEALKQTDPKAYARIDRVARDYAALIR